MFYNFLLFGLLIRLLFVPMAGFKADMAFWKGWGLAMVDKGIIWLVKNTNYNYPPGFSYVLYLINKTYSFFKSPYNIQEYWYDHNLLYLFLVKVIIIIADILVVVFLVKFGKKLKSKWVIALAIFYFLNPVTIFDGVIWGQVDQFGIFIFFASIYLLYIDKPKWATVIFTISFLMKFQNIIFIPLFFLYVFKRYSVRQLVECLWIAFVVFLIGIFPFWYHKEMEDLFRLLTINSDWFPWFSLNAFNLWWIVSGLNGLHTNDKTLLIGVVNAKQIGLLLFTWAYFVTCLSIFLSDKKQLFKNFVLATCLGVFAFFHLLTQSHERYLFPLFVLLPLFAMVGGLKDFGGIKKFFVFMGLLSLAVFLNMYISMQMNYPDQVIWPFSADLTRFMTLYLAILQIILFVAFLVICYRSEIAKYRMIIGVLGILLLAVFIYKNINYYQGKPIPLTSLTPVDWHQSYLGPVYGKTVDSARGPFFWNRLSDNYYFYEKGIGSHADSDITYSIKGKFSRFQSDYGIDTEGDQSAQVYFSVFGDGRELFKSQIKGRFDPPSVVSIDVRGVDNLNLKITRGKDSIFGAHADWLNPVLIK